MIRVLMVAECRNGGVPLFVRNLVEGLGPEDFSFGVACPTASELYREPPSGARMHALSMFRSIHPLSDPLAARRLVRIARGERYDIVHLNSSKAGVIGLLAGKRLLSKLIFTPHAPRSHAYSSRSPGRLLAVRVERAICRRADAVVAVSADEERHLIEGRIAAPEQVRTIENGIDPAQLSGPSALRRESIGVPPDSFVVGTIGRLSPQKDPLVFVRAAGQLAPRVPEAYFVVVGDGPLEARVRRSAAELGVAERFRFLGWRTDALDCLKLFDVFALTSRYEGMPFVLLEAAGTKRPIVSTAAPGVKSLITHGNNGLLAPVGDAERLAGHMYSLYRDPVLRARLAEEGFRSIAQARTLSRMVQGWEALYRSLVRQPAKETAVALSKASPGGEA